MNADTMPAPFPLIHVSGPPRERGRQHGRQAGGRIAAGIAIYRDAFANVGMDWPTAMDYAARFKERIQAFDAAMFDEIEGIAEGAEQPVEAVVTLNARTEILFWRDNDIMSTPTHRPMQEECTTALALPSVTTDGHLLHGQNWDWNPRCQDTSIVLRIQNDDGPDILTFVEAGQLARHGMNAAGVSLTANGLQCNLDSGFIGVPSPLARRRLLNARTLAGALDAVLNTPVSFSHNMLLGHRDGVAVDIEVTPEQCYWLHPENGFITHANHFKCPVARGQVKDIGLKRCPESLYRDQRLFEHFQAQGREISIDTFKTGFADTFGSPDAILRTPKQRPGGNLSGTVASLIMDSSAGRMWIAPSPYKGIRYQEYSL